MKKIVILLILLIPLAAFARFDKLVTEVNDLFGKVSGYVISTDSDTVYTDLGREKGVYAGMDLKIYRDSEPIIHPITGQVLGNKKVYIGDLRISDVQDKFSSGKLTNQQRAPQKGDIVVLNPPVDVSVSTHSFPGRLDILLKQELSGADNIIIKDKARFNIDFTQQKSGGIKYTVTDSSTGREIYSRFYADLDIENNHSSNAVKDILKSPAISKTYKSMAAGHIKNDGKIYLALATDHDVDIYLFDGKSFTPAGTLGLKTDDEIQNVEVADVNGNGTDEIFVTSVVNDYAVKSDVYEYDGKGYKKIASNIPYILRTVTSGGKKKIVSQRIGQDGTYLGPVQELVYRDGGYDRGAAVSPARDISIYGFGVGDCNNDGVNEVFNIDNDYTIDVYEGNTKKYTSVEEFGQTPYYFKLTNEIKQDVSNTTTEEGDDPFTEEKKKTYLKGRVFVNADGNIYVVKNTEKYKMLNKMKVYGTSSFSVFSWDGRRMVPQWESDVFQPVIVDYYMYEEYGRTYIFLLRNFSEGLFSSDKSELIYIETK